MLTENQKEAFRKIKEKVKVEDGGMNAKQRGDFYYRMSKILKEQIEGLNDLVFLLNELPDSYLEKIDLREAAMAAMELTEELVRRLDPAFPSPIIKDSKGVEQDIREAPPKGEQWRMVGRRVIRYFDIDMKSYLPGIADADTTIKTSYEPSEEEIAFLHRLTDHQLVLEKTREESARNRRRFTANEFNENILPSLKRRGKNFEAKIVSIVGDHVRDTTLKESIEQFDIAEKMCFGEEPK